MAIAAQLLTQILPALSAAHLNAVEVYIQFKPDLVSDHGEVSIEATEKFLSSYMQQASLGISSSGS